MFISNGWFSETDILFQNSIRYSHHNENYWKSLQEGIPPVGIRLNKKPAFATILEGFQTKREKNPSYGRNKFGATFQCAIG